MEKLTELWKENKRILTIVGVVVGIILVAMIFG